MGPLYDVCVIQGREDDAGVNNTRPSTSDGVR